MSLRSTALLAALSLLLAAPLSASAAGFRLPDQSASAMGMAGAFGGQADDASAAWYNPAGLTQLPGTWIAGGAVAIYPVLTHETEAGQTDVSKREIHLPPHFYASQSLNERTSIGVSINSPFGLSTDWSDTSATRYVATFSNIVAVEINPSVALQVTPDLSLAAGIAYVHMRATMEKLVRVVLPGPIDLGDHNYRLAGDGDGWGANFAALYKAADTLQIGLSYRSRIKVDLDGTADLTGGPAAASASGSSSITLPDLIDLGVSYRASEKLRLNADIDYTMWSTYRRLDVQSNVALFNATVEKQWKDVWCLRLGSQYSLSDQWKIRGGIVYDKNPVPDAYFETSVPDSDRAGITAGVGYADNGFSVDAAYMYLRFMNRTIHDSLMDDLTPDPNSLNGTYRSQAHLFALTIGYHF